MAGSITLSPSVAAKLVDVGRLNRFKQNQDTYNEATYAKKTPFVGATSTANGEIGIVPAPAVADKDKFLKGDGTWGTPAGGTGGSAYTLPIASATVLGGIKVGDNLSIDSAGVLSASSGITTWQTNTVYKAGEYITYNNNLFQVKYNHTSGATFDTSKFTMVGSSGSASIPLWESKAYYNNGSVVIHNKKIWLCTTPNDDTSFDENKWSQLSFDLSFWEEDSDGDLITKTNLIWDEFYNLDDDGDIIPKRVG